MLIEIIQNIGRNCNFKNSKNKIAQDDEYWTILTCTLHVIQYLLDQRLPFHGHDEFDHSLNQENFLHLLEMLAIREEKLNKTIRNSLSNRKWECQLSKNK